MIILDESSSPWLSIALRLEGENSPSRKTPRLMFSRLENRVSMASEVFFRYPSGMIPATISWCRRFRSAMRRR